MLIRNWSDLKYEVADKLFGKELDEAYKMGMRIGSEYATRRLSSKKASDSGIRSRRSELAATGLVIDTGDRKKMASGRMSIVWGVA